MQKVEVTFVVAARGAFAARDASPTQSPKNLFGKLRKAATSLAEKAEKALRIDEAKALVLEVHVSIPEDGKATFAPSSAQASAYGVEIHASEMFPEPSSTPTGVIGIFKPCLFMLPPNSDCRVRLRIRSNKKAKGSDVEPLVQTEFSMATLMSQLARTPCVPICSEVQVIALPPLPDRKRAWTAPSPPPQEVDLLGGDLAEAESKEQAVVPAVALHRALLGGHQGKLNPMQMSYAITQAWSQDPSVAPEVFRFRDTVVEPDIVKCIPLSLLAPTAKGLWEAAQAMRKVYHKHRLHRRQFNSATEAKANGYNELRVAVEHGFNLTNASAVEIADPQGGQGMSKGFWLEDLVTGKQATSSKAEPAPAEKALQGSRFCLGLATPSPQMPVSFIQPESQSFASEASASLRTLSGRLKPVAAAVEEGDGEPQRPKLTVSGSRKIYSSVTVEVRRLANADDASHAAARWEGFIGQTDSVVAGANPAYSRAGARAPRGAASKVLSDGCTMSTHLPASAVDDPSVLLVFRVWQMLEGRSAALIGEAGAPLSAFDLSPRENGSPRVYTLKLSTPASSGPTGTLHVRIAFETPRNDLGKNDVGAGHNDSATAAPPAEATLASMLQGLTEEKEDSDEEDVHLETEAQEAVRSEHSELQLKDFLSPDLVAFAEGLREEGEAASEDPEAWIGDSETWHAEQLGVSSMEGMYDWLGPCGFSPLPSLDSVVMEPPPPPAMEQVDVLRNNLIPGLHSGYRPGDAESARAAPEADLLSRQEDEAPKLSSLKAGSSVDPISPVMRAVSWRLTPLKALRDITLLYYKVYCLVEGMLKKEAFRLEQEELFRSSKLKTDKTLQAAPMNLHVHVSEVFIPPSERGQEEATLEHGMDFVTCGAATAHAFGFKPGGLLKNVTMLEELEKQIMNVYNTISLYNWEPAYRQRGAVSEPVFEKLYELGAKTAEFESLRTLTAVRQMCTLSQALCTCVSTFVSRLYLMLYEEFRPPTAFSSATNGDKAQALEKMAPIWVRAGFFVYWQGLLSSAGKEKGMIEDVVATLAVIHAHWRIRLQLSTDPARDDDVRAQCRIRPAACRVDIYLPRIFAPKFANTGATALLSHDIKLQPVLLTQGIDIRQTMANFNLNLGMVLNKSGAPAEKATAPPTSAAARLQQAANINLNPMFRGGAEFQKEVNEYGVSFFQSYLSQILRHRVEGDEASATAAVAALSAAVQDQDVTLKNTAVLINAEMACDELGGGRVTFCKSGKDRTAMAVTLEQTRRVYGGTSPDGRPSDAEDSERMRLTNVLRVGTRLQVAQKNIGYAKYSFNMLQRRFLPKAYQAPAETIQDYMTSALNADS